MTVSSSKAKKKALELLRENQAGASWRELGDKHGVNYATLNRFANSRGKWLPKDTEILKRLGLVTERSPYASMPRWWERTPQALEKFKAMKARVKKLSDDTREEQFKYRRKP